MKKLSLIVAIVASVTQAQTNSIPAVAETPSGVRVDAGADLRVRQEIMHNVPGLPGAPGAMLPHARKESINHIRIRPRAWLRLDTENFGLYARVADEFREHIVKNDVPRKRRSYNFPDEVILDNLYLEGRQLMDGLIDFRIGRQDLFDGRHSVFGIDHIIQDGSPYVGSRSCYADMARITFHPDEVATLDAFMLYDNGRNIFRYGNRHSRGRPVNAINPGDNPEMDEWGGGLVWYDTLLDGALPYRLYAVHKHNEDYKTSSGTHVPDKQITTVGTAFTPALTDNLSLDFDFAQQFGTRSNNTQAGGSMAYAAIDFHKAARPDEIRPYCLLSAYYLSGDRQRNGAKDNDTGWDPMWARTPCDSEMMQYGTLYGLGYWSNMLYTKLTLGADLGKRHSIVAYSGPMWAAVQDHLGHADGSGDSNFKGILSSIRYDFPLLLAPKNAHGTDRFEMFGHVVAELFNPGDYYDSSRPSYFIRWQVTFKF